jgi:hypothetical protein
MYVEAVPKSANDSAKIQSVDMILAQRIHPMQHASSRQPATFVSADFGSAPPPVSTRLPVDFCVGL